MKPKLADDLEIDVARLVETRLLVEANSGGGKSWALRRILEQTASKVQQLVIDPEGEFSTLREKFDYVICAPHDGDAVAHPSTAALLARRLLETGVSAIINIYDLKAHHRQAFVRVFCEALVNAPKNLWHPVLVVLDEAHVYCPERGHAESSQAVIDLATRGRKRGYCLCLATQRLSKLHKDAAAEMINKLIGRTGLDIDMKRAADELGFSGREQAAALRRLAPGEFFVFGPAFCEEVRRVQVGVVATTHPRSGHRLLEAPPEPSNRVKAIIAKDLKDLPKEAERESMGLLELKADNAALRAKVTRLEKSQGGGVPEEEVRRRIQAAVAENRARLPAASQEAFPKMRELLQRVLALLEPTPVAHKVPKQAGETYLRPPAPPPREGDVQGLRKGAVRILQELAARSPAGYSRAQVGTLTGFAPSGGTFNTYLGDLRRTGFIEEREGLVFASSEGIHALGGSVPKAPKTHAEVMGMWRQALRAGAFRILEAIVENPNGISREGLAAAVGMEAAGGTFNTYLGDLRRNGLIEEQNRISKPSSILLMGVK